MNERQREALRAMIRTIGFLSVAGLYHELRATQGTVLRVVNAISHDKKVEDSDLLLTARKIVLGDLTDDVVKELVDSGARDFLVREGA